jgi:sugar lactone lactonase YvrE
VYVVDALQHVIQIFDASGRLLLAVGEHGQGKGQFWLPNGIFVGFDDTIYVADAYNRRVQVFRYIGPAT